MRSLDEFARDKLAGLEARSLRRVLVDSERHAGAVVIRGGKRLISFSCTDYLGLSTHPAVLDAAATALKEHGLGSGGSRLVTGNHPLYAELERKLAAWKQAESALVFGSGYLANLGVIPALAGPDDIIIADELSHACLQAGARLSGARVFRYAHKRADAAEDFLRTHRASAQHALILTDGVFSMDGDIADLPGLAAAAKAHDAWLLVDDAHGLGVVGGGRGAVFAFGAQKVETALEVGALSKALGSYGGFLCANTPVTDLLKNRARTFVYSTALPPPLIAGAIGALDFIAANPAYVGRSLGHAQQFTAALGLPPAQTSIVPLVIGTAEAALAASAMLREEGYIVAAIRPPTVPEGTSRLRFAFSAAHEDRDVARLADLVGSRVLAGTR
jgi:8-amino-7-oxononanoate synthase